MAYVHHKVKSRSRFSGRILVYKRLGYIVPSVRWSECRTRVRCASQMCESDVRVRCANPKKIFILHYLVVRLGNHIPMDLDWVRQCRLENSNSLFLFRWECIVWATE